MHRNINSLINGFFSQRRMQRRHDLIRTIYLGYSSPEYRLWEKAGNPHGCVWRYRTRVIAVKLNFYSNYGNSQSILLKDNGDRSLPMFNRMSALVSHSLPNTVLVRTNPRRGIWHLIQGDKTILWLGVKQIHAHGNRHPNQKRLPSVEQRLTEFMNRQPVNLTSLDAPSQQPPDNENDDQPYVIPGYPALTEMIQQANEQIAQVDYDEDNEAEYDDPNLP